MRIAPAILAAAQAAEARWRVPASVQLGQYGLESGWGAHEPPGSHNPFGIKAKPGIPGVTVTTREEDRQHRSYFVRAVFASFPSEGAAFDAHARLIATAPCYAPAMRVLTAPGVDHAGTVQRFVNLLAPRYATAHDYALALWAVVRPLLAYDRFATCRAA